MTGIAPNERIRVDDPITLERFRNRLQSIADDAAMTIERTGVSPTTTETHDLSATLLDPAGGLIAGGGYVAYHWGAATHAVRATIARYGDAIRPGDVFFANDPYAGGGLHPNDVFVERPIFFGDRLVAWIALSAHLADMGGMARGSFAPNATECFQEAFRSPPVRLFRAGEEITDVWDMLLNNVRMATIVEMDLRALVAGAHVAQAKIEEMIEGSGADAFLASASAIQGLTEREVRRRIGAMEDGLYRSIGWVEWDSEIYRIPCTMTIDGERMIFDFEGASPMAPRFFNSQPYIIKSAMMMHFARLIAPDLPFSEGLLASIEMRCPERTIVHARPPAPMNAGHMHVGMTAAELMLECVRYAMWASEEPRPAARHVHGWSGGPAISLDFWAGTDDAGNAAIWSPVDGSYSGGSASAACDGADMTVNPVGMPGSASTADVEVLESWYPILITERSVRRGYHGAGAHRSGSGPVLRVQPYGIDRLEGQMVGIREFLPLPGIGGGSPGATTVYEIERLDGSVDRISTKAAGIALGRGETFVISGASGGGVGDPLMRPVARVADDFSEGRITIEAAARIYGVVLGSDGAVDEASSRAARDALRSDRLSRARPPAKSVTAADAARLGSATGELPLHLGIVQRGRLALVRATGTPLAVSPDHWTDGCAVIEEAEDNDGRGPDLVRRTYLDPRTGDSIHVEVVPAGEGRSFEISPKRWTQGGTLET